MMELWFCKGIVQKIQIQYPVDRMLHNDGAKSSYSSTLWYGALIVRLYQHHMFHY
jgi:hypothetical protein